MSPFRATRLLLALVTLLALVASGCGGDDDEPAAAGASDAPTATAAPSDTAAEPDASSDQAAGGTELVSTATTDLGEILVAAGGRTLYGFTPDSDGLPTCTGGCAEAWPPLLVEGDALPDGLDPGVYSVAEHPDGGFQLKAGKWPLYFFAGDNAPGDVNGQGSGGNWFVVAPDGSLIGA